MTKHKILMLALMVLATALRATGQCPTRLVFNPSDLVHTDTSAILTLNIKTNFCALGNGTSNDQEAFEAAGNFIRARGGHCKLVIPAGTYRAGRQIPGMGGWYRYPGDVLKVEHVRDVEIAGEGSPTIQLIDNLKYGFFDPVTGLPVNGVYTPPNDTLRPYAAAIGDVIRINGSERITVHDLVLDGNLYPGKMIIGGHDPEPDHFAGIQEYYSGIGVYFSRGIDINRVTTRRFGLDGVSVIDVLHTDTLPKTGKVYITDLVSDFNGRQGASFVWGDSVFVSNSRFTNTGMGEITYSGLQGGIDIEPEEQGTLAENFFFDNCIFENNRNANIIANSGRGRLQHVYFKNCKSYNIGSIGNSAPMGSSNFNEVALAIGRHKNLNFTDCEFYGYVHISRNEATTAAEGYKFKRCLFTDCYQKKVSWTTPGDTNGALHCALVRQKIADISTPLIFAPWTPDGNNRWEYLSIDSCIVDVYDRRPWLDAQSTYDKPTSVKNSTIYINNVDVPAHAPNATVMSDRFVMIDNNRIFLHDNQDYVHDGVTITGTGTSSGYWGSIQFIRWSTALPPNVCFDTVLVSCAPSTPAAGKVSNGQAGSALGYVVFPNPAAGNRFDLRNLQHAELYYELVTVNGNSIAHGSVAGYTTQGFNLPQLSAGIYYLKIIQANVVRVEKIVLQP